ncbi:AAA family ATPase [Streptomyces sp. 4N509B]|uniref:AAA family ATPase n=1 Tax=Streptomyces sp. 4N509B TaxID=3457413 RepID=UPI003FD0E50A
MLLSFRVRNHRSLHEEQQLTLTPVYEADRPEGAAWEAVPVAAVFGANAAGKSNVVDALRFMAHLVRRSHHEAEPGGGLVRQPFALDAEGRESPSWYVVDLLLEDVRYTYGFSVDDERVLDEWLHAYPHGRRRKLFERTPEGIAFGDHVPKKELELVASITEPNALFLTVAARSRQETVQAVYQWFLGALSFRTGGAAPDAFVQRLAPLPSTDVQRVEMMAAQYLSDDIRAASVAALLRAADLGIEGVGVESTEEAHRRLRADQDERVARQMTANGDELVIRLVGAGTRGTRRVWVEQRGRRGATRMALADQSQGTVALLGYAPQIFESLERGGLLVIDEVDASLHPRLTAHIIRLFQEPTTNPHGGQLLVTTHDASLLGRMGGEEILKRDQVWFVEKSEYGETRLFPLSDFKPRLEENRERRYLGGSYGAVPFLSDDRFEEAVAARGRSESDGAEPGE